MALQYVFDFGSHSEDGALKTIVSTEALNRALECWKARLALQAWRIEARFVPRYELGEARAACVFACEYQRTATIWIVEPGDYADGSVSDGLNSDWEFLLIHELVHLLFFGWMKVVENGVDEMLAEQATNALAEALLLLGRTHAPGEGNVESGHYTCSTGEGR